MMQARRQWIKERIPAFICKESNWWVSRWVQANVLLCPHCRKEYQSMKEVWDKLDDWTIDDPSENCEENFSHTFHQQFPSAFDHTEERGSWSPPGWFPKATFAVAVLILGAALFLIQDPFKHDDGQQFAEKPTAENKDVGSVALADPQLVLGNPSTVHSGRSRTSTSDEEVSQPNRTSPPSLSTHQIVPVHIDPAPQRAPHLQSLDRYRRTFEVNNVQLTGFGSLSFPVEKRSY